MKLSYYPDTDSLYIDLSARPSAESREVSEGVVLDYDEDGNLAGIDIDNASKKLDLSEVVTSHIPVHNAAVMVHEVCFSRWISWKDDSRFRIYHCHIHPGCAAERQERLSVGGKEPKADDMGSSRDPYIIVIVLDWQAVRSRIRVKFRPAQVDCLPPNRYNKQLINGPAQEIAPPLTPSLCERQ